MDATASRWRQLKPDIYILDLPSKKLYLVKFLDLWHAVLGYTLLGVTEVSDGKLEWARQLAEKALDSKP